MRSSFLILLAVAGLCLSANLFETKQSAAEVKEFQPESAPVKASEKALSPLERARGKEITWEDGKPIFVWGSLKDLPTLDDAFPSQKEQPKDFKFTTHAVRQVVLPETEERKRLLKGLLDENEDQLTAIISSNGKCIVEIYQGTPPPDNKQQKWLRGIDPKTKEVLWKYDEPMLYPSSFIQFAWNAERFILTDIYDEANQRQLVKLFSCGEGYLRNAAEISIDEYQDMVPPFLFPYGESLLNFEQNAAILYDGNGKVLGRWVFGEYLTTSVGMSEDATHAFILSFKDNPSDETKMLRRYTLLDINMPNIAWDTISMRNLGDNLFNPTNYSVKVAENGKTSGVWFMSPDYIDYIESSRNGKPYKEYATYGDIALLFDSQGIPHAFRLQSIDFTLSDDGRYLAANGKYYDISVLSQ